MRFARDLLNSCAGLPGPLQWGLLLVAGGGSVCMLGYALSTFMGPAAWIVAIGAILVVVLIVGFMQLVKWLRKRKANPMERDIMGHAGTAPQGVSAASLRARLDDLRRNFEEGIGKFRAAGKNLYSLPWYAIVGEPGSGKTEAIRHSCIGFPPGLHDPLQGSGGTINMNWWFTDKAVILDTAGRLMFEEVPAGSTSEWQEFLKLLRTYRYNCPINGLVLVIPADTLITDTADQIKAKANKIAEQLHLIQRILEVRFPVFVSITKCDLINGFREFFDNVTDPDLQQQILGWSNPAPLDERFNPERLSEHLEMVCDRLRRRRLGLMIDPMHTDDPSGRRIDQVDALYALPQSLARIAPRLRHYLDHVFAGGEWTGKPLFLRGIYFTSSMREGSALDEELAEALGVPVQSIQEGREWERERSFFLKHLFLEKIFKERGLVTRAINAGRLRRRRKAIVLAAGFLSVLALAVFTWFGARSLRDSIGIHRDYWVAAAKPQNWRKDETGTGSEYWRPIVAVDFLGSTEYVYGGQTMVEVGGDEVRVAQFHSKLAELAERPVKIPWVFWLAKLSAGSLLASRAEAQQLLFERSVMRPLADAARQKTSLPDGETPREEVFKAGWPSEFTGGLAELVRLESLDGELPDLGPLFRCALYRRPDREESKAADEKYKKFLANYEQYAQDREGLAAAVRWMYKDRVAASPSKAAGAGFKASHRAIYDGLDRYVRHWVKQGELATRQLDDILKLKEAVLKDYKEAEKRLLDTDEEFAPRLERTPEKKVGVVNEALAAWQGRLDDLYRVKATAESRLAAFPDSALFPVFEKTTGAIFKEVAETFGKFRTQAGTAQPAEPAAGEPDKSQEKSQEAERWRTLATRVNVRLDEALDRLKKVVPAAVADDIRQADMEFLDLLDPGRLLLDRLVKDNLIRPRDTRRLRLYEVRLAMYRLGDAERGKGDAAAQIGSLAKGIEAVEGAVAGACAGIAELKDIKPTAYRFKEANDVSVFAAKQLAMPQRIYKTLQDALSKAPDSIERVAADVEKAAQGMPPIARPKLPGTNMKGGAYDAKFHPEALKSVVAVCREAGQVLADPRRNILERDKLDTLRALWAGVISRYIAGPYVAYWTQTMPRDLESHGAEWALFRREAEQADFFEVFVGLGDVGTALAAALHPDLEAALGPDAKPQFATTRENVQAQIRKLKNDVYIQRCRVVRSNWTKLGDEPFKARTLVATLPDDEVFENYIPFETKNPEEFVDKYWTDLTMEFLRLLADGSSRQGLAMVDELTRRYSRFPLERPLERDAELSAAEGGEARRIVDAIVLQWKESPPSAAGEGERSSRIRAAVRKMLDEVRRLRIPLVQWEWVKRVKAVLDGLPSGDKALKCELWIPAKQPTPAAAHLWVHIRVKQGGKEIGKGNTMPAADYKLCEIWYPGEKLEIRLFKNPVDPEPNRAVDLDSLWAAVRMLHAGVATDPLYPGKDFRHQYGAEMPTEKKELFDPQKRSVEVKVEDDQRQPRLLRFRLDFEKGLPRVEDWPTRGNP